MARFEYGDIIVEPSNDSPLAYIKGHYDLDKANEILGKNAMSNATVTHQYAFFGQSVDEEYNRCQLLYLRKESGRGRFKITIVDGR